MLVLLKSLNKKVSRRNGKLIQINRKQKKIKDYGGQNLIWLYTDTIKIQTDTTYNNEFDVKRSHDKVGSWRLEYTKTFAIKFNKPYALASIYH